MSSGKATATFLPSPLSQTKPLPGQFGGIRLYFVDIFTIITHIVISNMASSLGFS